MCFCLEYGLWCQDGVKPQCSLAHWLTHNCILCKKNFQTHERYLYVYSSKKWSLNQLWALSWPDILTSWECQRVINLSGTRWRVVGRGSLSSSMGNTAQYFYLLSLSSHIFYILCLSWHMQDVSICVSFPTDSSWKWLTFPYFARRSLLRRVLVWMFFLATFYFHLTSNDLPNNGLP